MHALVLKVKARVKEMDSLATHAEKIGIDNVYIYIEYNIRNIYIYIYLYLYIIYYK